MAPLDRLTGIHMRPKEHRTGFIPCANTHRACSQPTPQPQDHSTTHTLQAPRTQCMVINSATASEGRPGLVSGRQTADRRSILIESAASAHPLVLIRDFIPRLTACCNYNILILFSLLCDLSNSGLRTPRVLHDSVRTYLLFDIREGYQLAGG